MHDALPTSLYTMRYDDRGFWTIVDTFTQLPLQIDGVPQTTQDVDVADQIVDMVNGFIATDPKKFIKSH